jgi:hypothetical protein
MDIQALKKAAKAESRRNGTSHQAELNAIAMARGYTHWGALAASSADALSGLPAGSYLDHDFDPPRAFLPIAVAPRDGTRLLVVGGPIYAAAAWRDGRWAHPIGGEGEPDVDRTLDFEPTHYAQRDDADAERQAMAASTPRMLKGLVERVEGLPEIELKARMMLGAQMHLHAAESFAVWNRKTGPRPDAPTRRPDGFTDRAWVEHLIARAEKVEIDPDALDTLRNLLANGDFDAIVRRNTAIVERMRSH